MLKLIIPVVLGLIGAGGGIAAGIYLKPDPKEVAELGPCGDVGHTAEADAHGDEAEGHGDSADHGSGDSHGGDDGHAAADDGHVDAPTGNTEFVKLNNQFVVPVLQGERVTSLVVLSLSLETTVGGQEVVFQREPKLRDSFLQVLFDHANAGGFSGAFTSGDRLPILRRSLLSAAKMALGDMALDVLVTDIARQDV